MDNRAWESSHWNECARKRETSVPVPLRVVDGPVVAMALAVESSDGASHAWREALVMADRERTGPGSQGNQIAQSPSNTNVAHAASIAGSRSNSGALCHCRLWIIARCRRGKRSSGKGHERGCLTRFALARRQHGLGTDYPRCNRRTRPL